MCDSRVLQCVYELAERRSVPDTAEERNMLHGMHLTLGYVCQHASTVWTAPCLCSMP